MASLFLVILAFGTISEETSGQVLWRTDQLCGPSNPLPSDGFTPAQCDPSSNKQCCSNHGWCGGSSGHCDCQECIDYANPSCKFISDTRYICPSGYYHVFPKGNWSYALAACPAGFRLAFLDNEQMFEDAIDLVVKQGGAIEGWTALNNPNLDDCSNSGCDGKLKYLDTSDGSQYDFAHDSSYMSEVDAVNSKACVKLVSDGNISGSNCSKDRFPVCQTKHLVPGRQG